MTRKTARKAGRQVPPAIDPDDTTTAEATIDAFFARRDEAWKDARRGVNDGIQDILLDIERHISFPGPPLFSVDYSELAERLHCLADMVGGIAAMWNACKPNNAPGGSN